MALDPSSTKIAVLGATGRTGSLFVAQALKAGYKIKGVCRTPAKLEKKFPNESNLEAVQGDVWDLDSLKQATEGCDVLCSFLEYGLKFGGCFDCHRYEPGYGEWANNVLIQACKDNGIKRVLLQSTWFSQSWFCDCSTANCCIIFCIRCCAAPGVWTGFEQIENALMSSDLDYSIFRCPVLGEETEATQDKFIYAEDTDQVCKGIPSGCSYLCASRGRADIARFFVENINNFKRQGVAFI